MAYRSTAEFVAALEAAGELVRIPFPVATELEITAWADREMKSPGASTSRERLLALPTAAAAAMAFS
jgi:3-polyprenyl-4-hydroxybenzoate decarboxylase